MAISSFFHNIEIKDEKILEIFLSAMEKSERLPREYSDAAKLVTEKGEIKSAVERLVDVYGNIYDDAKC